MKIQEIALNKYIVKRNKSTISSDFLVKSHGNKGYIYIGHIKFDKEFIGKRIRVYVEKVT